MRESIALLERSRVEVLNSQARMAPEALDGHFPEERHRLYRMLLRKAVGAPIGAWRCAGLGNGACTIGVCTTENG